MSALKAVIVDDEPHACQALKRMLAEFSEIEVYGQAGSIEEAQILIKTVRPAIVFLDIELFGENGFDLVPRLEKHIALVFVTAFNEYALRAFEVNALDYLMKPVTRDRLRETIRRLCDRVETAPQPGEPGQLATDDIILVQKHGRRHWVSLDTVAVIEAHGDFTVLRATDGRSGMVWRRMSEWEKILPEETFARSHRCLIVNLDHVETYESTRGNRLTLRLTGLSKPCHVSRRRTALLRQRLQQRASAK